MVGMMTMTFRRIFTYLGQLQKDPDVRKKQILQAYREAFAGDAGKLVLDDLANQFCFLDPTYRGDRDEALFLEGSRNVVLYILGMVQDAENNIIKEVIKR